MAYIAITISVIIVLAPISWLFFPERQAVLLTPTPSTASVGLDGIKVGTGQICIPQVKGGTHTFFVQMNNETISDEFIVGDTSVRLKNKQENDITGLNVINNNSVQLRVELCSDSSFFLDR